MGDVVRFPKKSKDELVVGLPDDAPGSAREYLRLCKYHLTDEDYIEVCLAILDEEEYDISDKEIKRIVDAYNSYF
jgi:hypothetical protein